MINKEEKKSNNIKYESDNLTKNDLIKFFEIKLKESQEKISEKKLTTEKEIIKIHNRFNKEIEKSRKFCLEKLIIDFLPVVDSIERALDLVKQNTSSKIFIDIRDKLQLICNSLKEFFTSLSVKKIDDVNILFNPSIHQAMSIHYTDEIESNQIVKVMQPGYILHKSRLLRPAMVIVSKEKP